MPKGYQVLYCFLQEEWLLAQIKRPDGSILVSQIEAYIDGEFYNRLSAWHHALPKTPSNMAYPEYGWFSYNDGKKYLLQLQNLYIKGANILSIEVNQLVDYYYSLMAKNRQKYLDQLLKSRFVGFKTRR
jgi:hypothetical protein